MKHIALLFLTILITVQLGWTKENVLHVKVINPLKLERKSETIAIRLDDIRKQVPTINIERLLVVEGQTEILSQVTTGELLFQSDFKPNEQKLFLIKQSSKPKEMAPPLVDGRFMKPREDYAWENDRIAFRMYGPAMAKEVDNGIDVWTKRVRHLIVEKWYKGDEDTGSARISYHSDHGEGADFFNVGRTLGAGGSGIWYNHRVYQSGAFTSQKTIANGPIRVTFELTYDQWNVKGNHLKEVKRISLDAGQNLNKIEVTFAGTLSSDLLIACGLAKRMNATSSNNEQHCWLSLWGPTNEDSVNGSLGTGVVIPKFRYAGLAEDSSQYIILGKAKPGRTFTYYSGAGWTSSGDFSTEGDWKNYLDACAQRIASPVRITLTKK